MFYNAGTLDMVVPAGALSIAPPVLPANVEGYVYVNGAGVSGIVVSAQGAKTYTNTTNAEGHYTLVMDPGTYNVSAVYMWGGIPYTGSTGPLTVDSSSLLSKDISISTPAAVEGHVYVNGAAAGGVSVSAGSGHSSTTDGNGYYKLIVPPGTYNVQASYVWSVDGATYHGSSGDLSLTAGQISSKDIQITTSSVIQGTITVDGSPKEGVRVSAGSHSTMTDGSGGYRIFVTAGAYEVVATDGTYSARTGYFTVADAATVQKNINIVEATASASEATAGIPNGASVNGNVVMISGTSVYTSDGTSLTGAIGGNSFSTDLLSSDGSPIGTLNVQVSASPGSSSGTITGASLEIERQFQLGDERVGLKIVSSLNQIPSGGSLDVKLEPLSSARLDEINNTLKAQGKELVGTPLAIIDITKTNMENGRDIGSTTFTFTVPRSSGMATGSSYYVIRYSNGVYEPLEARLVSSASADPLVFEVTSPNGLSTFTLVAAQTSAEPSPSPSPSPSPTPKTYTYHLSKGWNLISVPLKPADDSVEGFFPASVKASITDMWYYDNGYWIYYSGTRGYSPKYSHLTNVVPGRGYWVKVSSSQTFTISGDEVSGVVPSAGSGWTMFGVKNLNPVGVTSVYPGNKDMWYYDNGQWYYYSGTRGYSSKYPHLENLDPGKGYWVHN